MRSVARAHSGARRPGFPIKAAVAAVAGVALVLWGAVAFLIRHDAPARAAAAMAGDAAVTTPSASSAAGSAGSIAPARSPLEPSASPPGAAPAPPGRGATPVATRRGTLSAARDTYERARNLGAVFNALHTQSDPEALYFAERALRDCAQLLLAGKTGEPVAIDRYRPLADADPLAARRKAAYTALATRCAGFDLGGDPDATVRALREALAAVNDPRASLAQTARALRRGGDPGAAMSAVQALAGDGDPYVLEQAASVMGALRGRYVFMLDGELVRPDIVATAWTMASCDAGRECGAVSVQAPCAFLAECDAINVETALARYQLAPSDFERMQVVRARIVQGFTGNGWDPALFSPQPQPPWYRRGL